MWFDGEYSTYNDGKFITIPEIEKIATSLVERYKCQSDFLDHLQKENNELKNGVWEKNEIAKLKEENARYTEERRYSFNITKEDHEKIREWMNTHEKIHTGAIGGRYEYRFFPTGIGVIGTVVDTITKDEFTFQELS